MSATVLVTGPTGKVGRRLIPVLGRRGITVRTASRSPLPERAGIEPVRFDWTDQSVLNDDVLDVTGRPPVSFGEFAVGAAAAWRR